jgi:hypothetical protein
MSFFVVKNGYRVVGCGSIGPFECISYEGRTVA